jgi:thiamine-monophosphate kinase
MRLSEAGEFGLIRKIRDICSRPDDRILLGIGDDGAILRTRPGYWPILTTDALVEGIHFDLRYVPLKAIGWKSLAINISDVAAMGGKPVCSLITIAIPDTWTVENVVAIYEGINLCSRTYDCPVVGGDTVKSLKGCFISVTVMGEVKENEEKRRSGAKKNDLLCITGEMGGAKVGLEVLGSGYPDASSFSTSISRFLEPKAKIHEAQQLIHEMNITSMIDISDGLSSEIMHLCEASGLGCLIEESKIPISNEATIWAIQNGKSGIHYAMESGEEYELLFTVSAYNFHNWEKRTDTNARLPIYVIGAMKDRNEGILIQKGSEKIPLVREGWDHFIDKSDSNMVRI